MTGSAHVHEEQRISFAYWIGVFDLAEEVACVFKLRLEFRFDLLAHFIAALLNPRSDGGNNIFRPGAVFAPHHAKPFLRNAGYRSTPAGVKCSNGFVFRIGNQDGKAVGGENAKSNSGNIGDHAIAGESFSRKRGDDVNDVRVDLAQGDQIRRDAECGEKSAAVLLHTLARVVRNKAETSIGARAEAMD